MSEPVAPAAWYPDPSSTGVLRWWDGHVWTEHIHLSNPEPVAAVAAASPVSAVPSALTADAYGIRVSLDGQTFTVKATNFAAQGALGAKSRSIQGREITALDLIAPTMLRNGTLAVVTAAGKTLVRYRRKHASGVTAVHNALTGAAVGAATGETARRLVRSSYLQRGRGHSVEEVANQRWSRRVAGARDGGPSKVLAPNKKTPPAGLGTHPATPDHARHLPAPRLELPPHLRRWPLLPGHRGMGGSRRASQPRLPDSHFQEACCSLASTFGPRMAARPTPRSSTRSCASTSSGPTGPPPPSGTGRPTATSPRRPAGRT